MLLRPHTATSHLINLMIDIVEWQELWSGLGCVPVLETSLVGTQTYLNDTRRVIHLCYSTKTILS
jgi:hypothetical protein